MIQASRRQDKEKQRQGSFRGAWWRSWETKGGYRDWQPGTEEGNSGDTGEMEWRGEIDTQAGEGEMGHSEAGQGGDSKDRDKEDWSRHGQ